MAGRTTGTANVTRSGVTTRRNTQNASQQYLDSIKNLQEQQKTNEGIINSGSYTTDTEATTETGAPYWLNTQTDMGDDMSTGHTTNTGVTASSYYNKYLKEQQKAIQKKIDASVQANNAYIPEINQASDQSLQNAYILREQNKVNAPQALSAMGYTGGATETSMMGINTGYENTRNQVEQNRAKSLAEIQQNEAQIRATGDATQADAAATYYQNLVEAQQRAEANQQAQSNWELDHDLEVKKYEDAAAAAQWQRDYEEKIYNDRLLADKNATTSKSSSRSSGSSSSGTSSSSNSTNKNSSGNYNTVLTNVKRALGGSNAATTTAWNAAINYIQNSLKSGMITDYEANQMINQLGLN